MTNRPWLEEYDPEVPRKFEVEEVLLTTYLRRAAEEWPERTAIAFQGARLSYDRLADDVQRLSTALTRLGVEPGTRVERVNGHPVYAFVHIPTEVALGPTEETVLELRTGDGTREVRLKPEYDEQLGVYSIGLRAPRDP